MVTKENTSDSWTFWIGSAGIYLNASGTGKHHKSQQVIEEIKYQRGYKTIHYKRSPELYLNSSPIKKDYLFSFNCQSLHKHAPDLKSYAIVRKSNVILLTETRMKNKEPIDVPNLICCMLQKT